MQPMVDSKCKSQKDGFSNGDVRTDGRNESVESSLIEDGRCRVCQEQVETVEHLVAGCKVLANTEYLTRHNRAMMIMAVAWAKEHELIRTDMIWYEERWKRGTVIENDKAKLLWDIEFNLRKTTTSRRPDLILEEKEKKKIWICDMGCPQQHNIETKRLEKLTKYRQLAFEMRERRLGYEIIVVPVIVGALGGGMRKMMSDISRIFEKDEVVKKTAADMQKTALMDSETTLRKVLSGLIQRDDTTNF